MPRRSALLPALLRWTHEVHAACSREGAAQLSPPRPVTS